MLNSQSCSNADSATEGTGCDWVWTAMITGRLLGSGTSNKPKCTPASQSRHIVVELIGVSITGDDMSENPFLFWLHESIGVRNARNVLAWAVAGGAAYYFWILPQQQDAARRKAIVEEWKEKYRNEPTVYPVDVRAIERVKQEAISKGLIADSGTPSSTAQNHQEAAK